MFQMWALDCMERIRMDISDPVTIMSFVGSKLNLIVFRMG